MLSTPFLPEKRKGKEREEMNSRYCIINISGMFTLIDGEREREAGGRGGMVND